jgi:translation initiation factor 4E
MLGVIGENFSHGDEITGCVVSIRKAQDRISIWTKTANDREKCMSIGKEFKELVKTQDPISFQSHSDSAVKKTRFLC